MNYGNLSTNRGVEILNAWTPTNTDTDIPALSLTDDNNESRFSSYYVENGSFLKMDNLSLSYNFGRISRWFGLSASLLVQNVFCITKYSGADPEVPSGMDASFYPRPRTYSLTLGFDF